MRKLFFLFLFPAISILYAQESKSVIDLMEVEITATPRRLHSEMGRILQVVERAEIAQLPVQNIDELLNYIAGLDIRSRSLGGVLSNISIRGGSFDQVLILLNGINITNPQTGHYNLDIPLHISDVARIEILQGSAARVLGANAFSGAINIITEHPPHKQLRGQMTHGSYNTGMQNVSANYYRNNFSAFASASHQQSDGHIENTDYVISNAFVHLIQRTDLSSRRKNVGRFDLQLGTQNKAYGANSFFSFRFPNQFTETRTFFSALSWSLNGQNWRWNAQGYWRQHHDWFQLFRDYRDENFNPAPDWYRHHNYHQSDVAGARATGTFISPVGRFTTGIDLRNEHIFSNVLGTKMKHPRPVPFGANAVFTHSANRLLSNVFVDYSTQIDRFHLSVGGAVNHTQAFGAHYVGGFELGYFANHKFRMFASYNSAVRLPTFTELYFTNAEHDANSDLQPEKSQTFEAGFAYQGRNLSLETAVFYRLGSNIIDWVKYSDAIYWESRNWTNVNALGTDIALQYNFQNSFIRNIRFVHSFLHVDKNAQGFLSRYALDFLRHKCVLSVNHHIWRNLSVTWKASFMDRSGSYLDFATGEMRNYEPYFLLDTRLLWSEARFDIFADLNNIFNTGYADYGGLRQPGLNWNVGMRFRIF